jgi:hypothetical protein
MNNWRDAQVKINPDLRHLVTVFSDGGLKAA